MKTPKLTNLAAALALVALSLAASAAPAAAQQACGGVYTIRPGDTLADIALRCATSVPALLANNPSIRDDQDLRAGGALRVPPPGLRPTPMEACGGFYSLREGDTLEEIALKCGLTVPLILAANPGLEDPDALRAGGSVRIPDLPPPDPSFRPVIVSGQTTGAGTIVAGAAPTAGAATGATTTATAASAARAAASSTMSTESDAWLRYEGVLREGARCTILRTADGTDVGIVDGVGPGFRMGERAVVTGPVAPAGSCGTARAVMVRIMWRP